MDRYSQRQWLLISQLMQKQNIEIEQSVRLLKMNHWNIDRVINGRPLQNQLTEQQVLRSMILEQEYEYKKMERGVRNQAQIQSQRAKKERQMKNQQIKKDEQYRRDALQFSHYKEGDSPITFMIRTADKTVTKSFNRNHAVNILFKYANGCLRDYFEEKYCEFDIKFWGEKKLERLSPHQNKRLYQLFPGNSMGYVLIIHEK